jgi:hypothetical protein
LEFVIHWDWGGGSSSSIGKSIVIGITIPSFRIALAIEEAEWKPFCKAP